MKRSVTSSRAKRDIWNGQSRRSLSVAPCQPLRKCAATDVRLVDCPPSCRAS